MELPKRKNIRLKDYDYSQRGAYFLTVCVKDKHELLGEIAVGDAVRSVPSVRLSDIGEQVEVYLAKVNRIIEFAFLEKYVIMPNHIHLLIVINCGDGVEDGNGTHTRATPIDYNSKSTRKK